ncbi:MAG: hypothetical protein JOZ54_25165 [Acidobacteria bacterium]|nr:hypothetical protein [Acidobacteriota bacterium]
MTGQIRNLLGAVLLATTTSSGFYTSLLDRGIEQVQKGDYTHAVQALRVAAFGFVDDVPSYQTAQIYLAIANEKLGKHDEAQIALKKAARAESITPTYRSLKIAANVRAEFEKLSGAGPLMQMAASMATTPATTRPASPKVAQTTPAKSQPVKPQPAPVTKPQVAQKTPAPTPVTPQPATPKISAPAPAAKAPVAPPVTERQYVAQPQPQPAPVSAIAAAAKHEPSQAPILGADIAPQLAAAQSFLNEGRILAARQTYIGLAAMPSLRREQMLAVAKGLSDTSAYRESSQLYTRVAPFVSGEETHMFAEAVNRYELGDRATAKTLLNRALPYLPKTREILLYRGKIEGQP